MKGSRYKKNGWYGESYRHYLASKGIKSTYDKHDYFARDRRRRGEKGGPAQPPPEKGITLSEPGELGQKFALSDALEEKGVRKEYNQLTSDVERLLKQIEEESAKIPARFPSANKQKQLIQQTENLVQSGVLTAGELNEAINQLDRLEENFEIYREQYGEEASALTELYGELRRTKRELKRIQGFVRERTVPGTKLLTPSQVLGKLGKEELVEMLNNSDEGLRVLSTARAMFEQDRKDGIKGFNTEKDAIVAEVLQRPKLAKLIAEQNRERFASETMTGSMTDPTGAARSPNVPGLAKRIQKAQQRQERFAEGQDPTNPLDMSGQTQPVEFISPSGDVRQSVRRTPLREPRKKREAREAAEEEKRQIMREQERAKAREQRQSEQVIDEAVEKAARDVAGDDFMARKRKFYSTKDVERKIKKLSPAERIFGFGITRTAKSVEQVKGSKLGGFRVK